MKLRYAHIENFKGLNEVHIDFFEKDETGTPALHAIVGDNGSGKTTVLQAIALTLSLATKRTFNPLHFAWNGFLPERLGTRGPTRVELGICFDADEISAIQEIYKVWNGIMASQIESPREFVRPGDYPEVTVEYKLGHVECPQGPAARFQLLGRHYLKQVMKSVPDIRRFMGNMGDVFWFDQYRNLGEIKRDDIEEWKPHGWNAGIDILRRYMVGWWSYHTTENQNYGKDYIPELERCFSLVFPEIKFEGVVPMRSLTEAKETDFYFLLNKEGISFDITELSSGEQSIFSIAYEFARLEIRKSIVIIDELELHLHSPEQQALLTSLPDWGPENQFITSTHSKFVEGALVPSQITRLRGGHLCL